MSIRNDNNNDDNLKINKGHDEIHSKEDILTMLKGIGWIAALIYIPLFIAVLFGLMSIVNFLRLSTGIFGFFFLPGYMVLLNMDMETAERIVFSVPVSMTAVMLPLYAANILFRFPITAFVVGGSVIIISALGLLIALYTDHKTDAHKSKKNVDG